MPRGGKREGAGRKPGPPGSTKKQYCNKFPVVILNYFKSLPNAAQTIEELVTKSKGFREWQQKDQTSLRGKSK